MQELTEIATPDAHTCDAPAVERWRVLEPVSARWYWLTVYACCGQVLEESAADSDTDAAGAIAEADEVIERAA